MVTVPLLCRDLYFEGLSPVAGYKTRLTGLHGSPHMPPDCRHSAVLPRFRDKLPLVIEETLRATWRTASKHGKY